MKTAKWLSEKQTNLEFNKDTTNDIIEQTNQQVEDHDPSSTHWFEKSDDD